VVNKKEPLFFGIKVQVFEERVFMGMSKVIHSTGADHAQ
jgi:hypothetical protein